MSLKNDISYFIYYIFTDLFIMIIYLFIACIINFYIRKECVIHFIERI